MTGKNVYSLNARPDKGPIVDRLPPPPLKASRYDGDRFYLTYPYYFKAIDAPARVYLPLNRFYQPLGMRGEWVNYEDFAENFVRLTCPPDQISGVWYGAWGRLDDLGPWLYCDSEFSIVTYPRRYAKLLEYVVPDIIPHTLYAATAVVNV